ncbi:MAG: hypothetical protein KKD83_06185 [Chloroflexi bacterium]|nr:hypothetical protein [Chloroflexota bacterium]
MDYFVTVDTSSPLKIYQDGLLADGALDRRIIEEGQNVGTRLTKLS